MCALQEDAEYQIRINPSDLKLRNRYYIVNKAAEVEVDGEKYTDFELKPLLLDGQSEIRYTFENLDIVNKWLIVIADLSAPQNTTMVWGDITNLDDDGSEERKKKLLFYSYVVGYAIFLGGVVVLSIFYTQIVVKYC